MTEIEVPVNDYCSKYETMAKDIREGMDEGFNEGLSEGIKKGFVAGIRECMDKGFDEIEVKCMKEILKDAFKTSSDETTRFRIKHTVGNKYREKISPSFKKKMEEACDKAIEEIKNTDFELDKRPASGLKSCVETSVKKIKECIGNSCGDMRKKFPTDLIFGSFFDCLQDEFNRDLDENLEACEKRICKEIDNKIDNRKLDHERH
ncbi:hypothetical protein [Methanosarcina sp. WWM596]|uniref:hypothetical protein n=1 Tax=Methanosarcina sp. WWM596 TaxID=1434103 RepID=UPI000615603F|nr:hypothetical protein [Methanosarcina sp. WWM596]AKB18678.1 hypothetical protein MSWHS_1815 [Methanosarcina sp. WWM596]